MEENRYIVALLPVTPHIHPHRQLKMELVEVKAEKERGLNRIERYKVRG